MAKLTVIQQYICAMLKTGWLLTFWVDQSRSAWERRARLLHQATRLTVEVSPDDMFALVNTGAVSVSPISYMGAAESGNLTVYGLSEEAGSELRYIAQ